jgi:cytochrome c oxidase assembly factor CtaG
VLIAAGALYARGAWVVLTKKDVVHGLQPWQAGAFAMGWLTAALTLFSPLERLGAAYLSGHMAQHALLTLVAAPLVVLGRPLVPLLWAFPPDARKALVAETRTRGAVRTWRFLTNPLVIFFAHAGSLWLWHVPAVAEAAAKSEVLHALQHASVFFSAVLLFQAIVYGRAGRMGYGAAVALVFAAALHTLLLGALLVFAPGPWYPLLARANDPLLDQRLAGLVLWIPTLLVFTAVGLALLSARRAAATRSPPRSNVQRLTPRGRPFTRTRP